MAVIEAEIPEAYVSQSVCLVRLKNPALAKFIHLQLTAKRGDKTTVEAMAYGLGRPVLNLENIRSAPIRLAPAKAQVIIVAEIEKQFSRLDEAVANLKRVKASLKRYKAAVLKAAVEGRLTEDWRKQHPNVEPASKLLERILAERRTKWKGKGKYKEPTTPGTSDLPHLPAWWSWATMPQLGELNRGKSKHRPRNDPRLFGGPYPFIQTGDVRHSGGFVRSHSQTYNESGLAQSHLWPTGTLCITIAANIGETGILTYPACFPDSVVGFVFDGCPVTIRFIDLFFRTEREKIARFAPATAQKNINIEILSEVAVPIPSLDEQKEIVAEVERRLSIIEELEAAVEVNLSRADRLRQSILQQAFCGELAKG
jgi:type I restriction enzyme S subunit